MRGVADGPRANLTGNLGMEVEYLEDLRDQALKVGLHAQPGGRAWRQLVRALGGAYFHSRSNWLRTAACAELFAAAGGFRVQPRGRAWKQAVGACL